MNEMFNINNSFVLNNGIDFKKFENLRDKNGVRLELKIPNDAFVIGHVGRFDKVKNHDFLIEIFNEININKKNVFLLMIGSGEEKERIKQKLLKLGLSNYLILENRTDVADLLNAIDVFVFPSFKEGIPLSIIEAQKAKVPCFMSKGVPREAIISNIVSRISLDKNTEYWAKKILDYNLPKEIILNDKEWDINNILKKLENIYNDIIKEKEIR